MKKVKHIEKDAERLANVILYWFTLIAIFLIFFFCACYLLNGIIDSNLDLMEKLAENAIRIALAGIKIGFVVLGFVAVYKVFIEPNN